MERGKTALNVVITKPKKQNPLSALWRYSQLDFNTDTKGTELTGYNTEIYIREIKPTSSIRTSCYNGHQGGEVEAEPTGSCIREMFIVKPI